MDTTLPFLTSVFLLSSTNCLYVPDVNVSGNIADGKIQICCESMNEPLDAEFIVHGKSHCTISMSKKECDECICRFLSGYKVIIESETKLRNNSVYGCEMVFDDGRGGIKIYSSVSFNGKDFEGNKKEITGVGHTLNNDKSSNKNPESGEDKKEKDVALIVGVVVGSIAVVVVFTVICLIIKKRRRRKGKKGVTNDKSTTISNPEHAGESLLIS